MATVKTYETKDPAGNVRRVKSSRLITAAAFVLCPDGSYGVRFAKDLNAARRVYGARGQVGKAYPVQG